MKQQHRIGELMLETKQMAANANAESTKQASEAAP